MFKFKIVTIHFCLYKKYNIITIYNYYKKYA